MMDTVTAPLTAPSPAPAAGTLTLEQLAAAALSRPERERAELAERLLDSLPPEPAADEDEEVDWNDHPPGYREEIMRRLDDLRSGREEGVPWEEVQAKVERIIAEECR